MENCAFCSLPEINDRVVAENSLAKAFLTNIPIVFGHTLIVPKRCVRAYEDLTSEEKGAIESLRGLIVKNFKENFGAEGFNFAWNDAKMAGQSVPHFHLHVLARKTGDKGIYNYEPREFLYRTKDERTVSPEEELAQIAKEIKSKIA